MKHKADIEIGERARKFVVDSAISHHSTIKDECGRIGFDVREFHRWKQIAPSVYCLQQMALAGANTRYILTGKWWPE